MNQVEDGSLNELIVDERVEPRLEYERRREARRAEAARHIQRFRSVGFVRLGLLACGSALGWCAFRGLVGWWWLLPIVAAFLALAEVQQRITLARRRSERAAALYDEGLARLSSLC
jgi:hypothetical protein